MRILWTTLNALRKGSIDWLESTFYILWTTLNVIAKGIDGLARINVLYTLDNSQSSLAKGIDGLARINAPLIRTYSGRLSTLSRKGSMKPRSTDTLVAQTVNQPASAIHSRKRGGGEHLLYLHRDALAQQQQSGCGPRGGLLRRGAGPGRLRRRHPGVRPTTARGWHSVLRARSKGCLAASGFSVIVVPSFLR